MRILTLLALFLLVAVISAKKQHQENVDAVETESKDHSAKKYSKEHQKSHHHKHKKHAPAEELINAPEPKSKQVPLEVPESEIQLQENIETSKKEIHSKKHAEQVEDLHLQDLTYENLKKEKKKGHHGAHQAEILEKNDQNAERKLFAEQESKHAVDEKVIEDSFEPLQNEAAESGKKQKPKDKKQKDKSKSKKKAYEKNKNKGNKKSKEGKKNNKDKKNKNKDKKKH